MYGIRGKDVAKAAHFRAIDPRRARRPADADLAGFGLRRFDLLLPRAECARAVFAFDPIGRFAVDERQPCHARKPHDLAASVWAY